METSNHKEMSKKMDKQGMRVFMIGTAAIYGLALVYCFSTGRIFETVLVGLVTICLGAFIGWMYKSA